MSNLRNRYLVTVWALGNIGSFNSSSVSELLQFIKKIESLEAYPTVVSLLSRMGTKGIDLLRERAIDNDPKKRIIGLSDSKWVSNLNKKILGILAAALEDRDRGARRATIETLFHLLRIRTCVQMKTPMGTPIFGPQHTICLPPLKPDARRRVLSILERYLRNLVKNPTLPGAGTNIVNISRYFKVLKANKVNLSTRLYALLKAPRLCRSDIAKSVVTALNFVGRDPAILSALKQPLQRCVLDALHEKHLDNERMKRTELNNKNKRDTFSLNELIDRARAFCKGDDSVPSGLSDLSKLIQLDPSSYEKKMLHKAILSDEPRIGAASVRAMFSDRSGSPVTVDDLKVVLLNKSPHIRKISSSIVNRHIIGFSGKELKKLELLIIDSLTGPVLTTRGLEKALDKAYCSDCRGIRPPACSGDDGHVSLISLLSIIRREPTFPDRLMTGQVQKTIPDWSMLGIEGKRGSPSDLQPQIVPRQQGQSVVRIEPEHKRIAYAIQNHLRIDDSVKQRFIRSFVNISYKLQKPPTVTNGIVWTVEYTGSLLREFGGLFAQFTNCRRAKTEFPYGTGFPYCDGKAQVKYFYDGKPIKPLKGHSDPESCDDASSQRCDGDIDRRELFHLRNPAPGEHLISTEFIASTGYKNEAKVVLRENLEVVVKDDNKGCASSFP